MTSNYSDFSADSDQEGSQGETKKKAKWKKKKKKNADEYAIGFHKKSKEEILMVKWAVTLFLCVDQR